MADKNTQRVRRLASPSMGKQGPLKATKSFGLKTQTSPSGSPTQWSNDTHRKRRSPDHNERGSPNSPTCYKEKSKPVRYSPVPPIKRTGSYETIAAPYLKGEWPKGDQFNCQVVSPVTTVSCHSCDKSTQTEEWDDKKSHKRSSSLGNGEVKNFKARLAKSKEGSKVNACGAQRSSPLQGNHFAVSLQTKAVPVNIPYIPKTGSSTTTSKTRGSVEGLNQEIEKLVLLRRDSGVEDDRTQDPTPDGHRAPIVELLNAPETRNVDTQTPSGLAESSLCMDESSNHSSPSSIDSPTLPIIPVPGAHDSPRVSSTTGLEVTGKEDVKDGHDKEREDESPNLNSFNFVREPPDGCEKVKTVEDSKRLSTDLTTDMFLNFPPIKKPLDTCRIPSKSSAFCPLLKPYTSQPEMAGLKPSMSPKEKEFLAGSP